MGSMETSRRNLLNAGTAAAAAVAAAPLTAQAAVSAENTKFDATYDVVVVGSGFAGMACAYKAAKAGLSVLMIEKMGVFGGNSAICGGNMACPVNPVQKA